MTKYDEDYLNSLITNTEKSWEGIDVNNYMNNLKDNSIDKEAAEELSKKVTSYIIEQIKFNMNIVTVKCRDLMVRDWITNRNGFPMQITNVGEDYVYATFEGNEADPWEFDGKDDQPQPIPLTPEILEKNGWKEAQFWHEYQDGKNTIQSCLPDMRGIINGVEIQHFKCEYVHQYQHLLRLCGLDDLADNFKV